MSIEIKELWKLTSDPYLIVFSVLGVLVSLRDKKISLVDAEAIVFSPRSVAAFRRNGVDSDLCDLIYLGCELEDIESIIPDKFDSSVDGIIAKFLDYLSALRFNL